MKTLQHHSRRLYKQTPADERLRMRDIIQKRLNVLKERRKDPLQYDCVINAARIGELELLLEKLK